MFKKTVLIMVFSLLVVTGCSLLGGGGLKDGDIVEADLSQGINIEALLPNAETVLLVAGIAVEDDWPALEFELKAGDGVSLFVEAEDIDPVMVVLDEQDNVLTIGDDWDEELDAFVSLNSVGDGVRVIVFDISGDDGTFLLEVGSPESYQWFLEVDEEYEFFILEDKENDQWSDLLEDVSDLYRDSWETCVVLPLEITGEKWVKIAVESDVDCIMAILLVDDDELQYIDFDDDTDGVNPVFSSTLVSGNYMVIVDSYSGSEDVEFYLTVEELDIDEMTVDIVIVNQIDEWFGGVFSEAAFVMSYWPEAGDYYGILPEERALVFEFDIEESGSYIFEVECSDDTKMAIVDSEGVMIDYNDDNPDGGLDPMLILQLSPGYYSAIVVPYGDNFESEVNFRYSIDAVFERELGTVPTEELFRMSSNLYTSMMFESGNTYEIFAESEDIDLTLTVVDREGIEYFSDDDGGDFNPYLVIECNRANSGLWEIDLEAYSGEVLNGEVYFVVREEQSTRREDSARIAL